MKPRIVISSGDPAGVGPEVTVKALQDPEIRDLADWIVVGDQGVFRVYGVGAQFVDAGALRFRPDIGSPSAEAGTAALAYVRLATDMCLCGGADAMVTAPVNKHAVAMSGVPFSGHTEYIAKLTGAPDSRMLLVGPQLRVVHVTTHVALRAACDITQERVRRTLELGCEAMHLLGIDAPRIAVCGLNPHAGEEGLFGREDLDVILPAIMDTALGRTSRAKCCIGPLPADTVFLKAVRGEYDLVVAMYHDQGHIPMKLLDFERTVNVSLGLPIIRTSVDHGTAFDIAGKGIADPGSMIEAMKLAVVMAANRARVQSSSY